jgi:CDP-diacylglycerol---glycerol-3-phosphate 3-phosphatidyltransferase
MRINLPNQITIARLILAIVFFFLLSWFDPHQLNAQRWLLNLGFWVFLVAAITDILDGLIARMMRSVTSFGRILDPVVDKVMVCGAFMLFASHHFWDGHNNITNVQPWMVLVLLTREFLVSAVRSHAEAEGQNFAASWVGKVKMFVQSATVCIILGTLAWDLVGLEPLRQAAVWTTVVVTTLSAFTYIHRAHAFLLSHVALGGTAPPVEPRPEGDSSAQPSDKREHGDA